MDLRRLRSFVVLAEELHFGRAAARLHLAQPPLSQHIQQLEAELDVKLFDRTTRRVSLTNAGALLLPDARRLLADAGAIERVIADYRTGQAGSLRLGFVDSSSFEVMPRFLRSFRERWPQVTFELSQMSSETQFRAIVDGELDVGLSRSASVDDSIRSTEILREPMYVAVDSDHRLAGHKSTQLNQLKGESFIGFDSEAAKTLHAELTVMLRGHGVSYEPIFEAPEYTTILGLVAAGEGIALAPAGVRTFQPPGLTYVRIRNPEATVSLSILTRRNERLQVVGHAVELADELFA